MAKTPQRGGAPRKSWKGSEQKAAAPAARGRAEGSWTRGTGREVGHLRWMRGLPLLGLAIALVIAFVVVAMRWPRPTPLVCMYVTDYEAPLPPQAFAQEDIERLIALFPFRSKLNSRNVSVSQDHTEAKAYEGLDPDRFIQQLCDEVAAVDPGGPYKDVVLIYLSLQGTVNDQNKACLMLPLERSPAAEPGGIRKPADTLSKKRLVPLADLVSAVAEIHPRARKVIFLDSVRWDHHWQLGRSENPFAADLAQLLADTDNVFVFNSCADAEVGLVDLRQGATLFGEYVGRGLWGEADGEGEEGSADGKVTLSELESYLKSKVRSVAARRYRRQEPMLFQPADGRDFVLARANKDAYPAADVAPQGTIDQQHLAELDAKWKELDARSGAVNGHPAGVAIESEAWRQNLLRQEALAVAGKAYTGRYPDLPNYHREAAQPKTLTASLPLALGSPKDSVVATWKTAFEPRKEGEPPPMPPPPKLTPAQNAYVAWEQIRTKPLEPADLFERVKWPSASPVPVELRAAARLSPRNEHLPESIVKNSAALADLLDCRQQAELAIYLAGDQRLLSLLETRLKSADDARRSAEDWAFAGEVKDVQAVIAKYKQLQADARTLATALAQRDRISADLPYLLEWAIVSGGARFEAAKELLKHVQELDRRLASGEKKDEAQVSTIAASSTLLDKQLRLLIDAYQDQAKTSLSAVHLGELQHLEALLAAPLAIDRRAALWKKYAEIIEADDLAPDDSQQVPAPDRLKQERDRVGELLEICLHAGTDQQHANYDRWLAEGDEALDADGLETDELRAKLRSLDRILRWRAPWLVLDWPLKVDPVRNPLLEKRLYRNASALRGECDSHDYCLALAERFIDDFYGNDDGAAVAALEPSNPPQPYFHRAASAMLATAAAYYPTNKAAKKDAEYAACEALLAKRASAADGLVEVFPAELKPASEDADLSAQTLDVNGFPSSPLWQSCPAGVAMLRLSPGGWSTAKIGASVAPPADAHDAYLPLTIPKDPSPEVASLLPASLRLDLTPEATKSGWNLDFYYRGHTGHSSIKSRSANLIRTIVNEPVPPTGVLTINSPLQNGTVAILLDCSESMNQQNRMIRARPAVREAIKELLGSGKLDVILVCFGHRRGWVYDAKNPKMVGNKVELPWNDPTGRSRRADVTFHEDYEIVWDSKRDNFARLEELLGQKEGQGKIKPIGYTPLHSAAIFAIDQCLKGKTGSRHLVIVSDGDDTVPEVPATLSPDDFLPSWSTPKGYNSAKERAKRIAALKERKEDNEIQIHMMSLGNAAELKALTDQLEVPLADVSDFELVKSLRQSIGIYDYQLIKNGAGLQKSGTTIKQEDLTGLVPGGYTLRIAGAGDVDQPFEIFGGEHLMVQVRPESGKPTIFFEGSRKSAADDARAEKISSPEAAEGPRRGLRPDVFKVLSTSLEPRSDEEKTAKAILVAIESQTAGMFVPRPEEVWIELTPAIRASAGAPPKAIEPFEPYLFSNPTIEPGEPVPSFRLVAPAWPKDANCAIVNVWFRPARHPEATIVSLRDYRKPTRLAAPHQNSSIRLRFSRRPEKTPGEEVVQFRETHEGSKREACLLNVFSTWPSRVERLYYDNGEVEHRYHFQDFTARDADEISARALPLSSWKRDAATNAKPLVVDVR
jgi:hypothetical protein